MNKLTFATLLVAFACSSSLFCAPARTTCPGKPVPTRSVNKAPTTRCASCQKTSRPKTSNPGTTRSPKTTKTTRRK